MRRIVVAGAGFAGLWSAVGAARKREELGLGADELEIVVVDRNPWHSIRVRNYEADLRETRVPLDQVLGPIGVRPIAAEVHDIDFANRHIICSGAGAPELLPYDRLVFALGSRVVRPPISGLDAYGYDVDTYEAADRLNAHIAALSAEPPAPGRDTVLVIGAGLTGIEVAAEMPDKLRQATGGAGRVILADRQEWIGSDMGEEARAVIAEALAALGVETRPGVSVAAIDGEGAVLTSGERIAARTVVWCAGMEAHPLTRRFPVRRDRFGRVPVDPFMKILGMDAEFAAGDAAWFAVDGERPCVMSCQHARPMGRFAGHNVVCDLLGLAMVPLRIDWYSTILDLGPWGAVCTAGWQRRVATTGAAAKRTKEIINRQRIYPPLSADPRALFEAAAPVVQDPPAFFR
ncbi:MAG TPA: FAD-dependent oxidoreductase [Stellaceae bacterium]|nr:FAD-dependent oxidoreductase [Stellaceae bacterium]